MQLLAIKILKLLILWEGRWMSYWSPSLLTRLKVEIYGTRRAIYNLNGSEWCIEPRRKGSGHGSWAVEQVRWPNTCLICLPEPQRQLLPLSLKSQRATLKTVSLDGLSPGSVTRLAVQCPLCHAGRVANWTEKNCSVVFAVCDFFSQYENNKHCHLQYLAIVEAEEQGLQKAGNPPQKCRF